MRRWLLLVLGMALVMSAPDTQGQALVPGSGPVGLSLDDAIALGLRNNRAIRGAHLQRVAQKFDLRVAEDRFKPQLTLSSRYQASRNRHDRSSQSDLSPASTLLTPYGTRISLGWVYGQRRSRLEGLSHNDGANLMLIQPLLRGAGPHVTLAPVRQARLAEQANRLNLKSTIAATITRIVLAYRELLRAQHQQQIADQALQRTRQLLEVNRTLIAAGRMAAFDIVQTEAQVANQELNAEHARNQLQTARLALLHLLALDLSTPSVATDTLQARRVEINTPEALQQALGMQPGWLSQLIASEQASIALHVARDEQRWDVSLVAASSQVRGRNTSATGARQWEHYAGLQLEIPFTDTRHRQARVQAQVNLDQQALQLTEARQQLEQDVRNAVGDIDTRWRQLEIARRAGELAQRKLAIEQEKLTLGRSSNFQVLSFEADLRDAQTTRLDAVISYLNAQTALDQTLGTTLQSWSIALHE